MNPAAILALISDLYEQIGAQQEQNKLLRQAIERLSQSPNGEVKTAAADPVEHPT